jgi:hypothetical protein
MLSNTHLPTLHEHAGIRMQQQQQQQSPQPLLPPSPHKEEVEDSGGRGRGSSQAAEMRGVSVPLVPSAQVSSGPAGGGGRDGWVGDRRGGGREVGGNEEWRNSTESEADAMGWCGTGAGVGGFVDEGGFVRGGAGTGATGGRAEGCHIRKSLDHQQAGAGAVESAVDYYVLLEDSHNQREFLESSPSAFATVNDIYRTSTPNHGDELLVVEAPGGLRAPSSAACTAHSADPLPPAPSPATSRKLPVAPAHPFPPPLSPIPSPLLSPPSPPVTTQTSLNHSKRALT